VVDISGISLAFVCHSINSHHKKCQQGNNTLWKNEKGFSDIYSPQWTSEIKYISLRLICIEEDIQKQDKMELFSKFKQYFRTCF
jgi:hypothetical protein